MKALKILSELPADHLSLSATEQVGVLNRYIQAMVPREKTPSRWRGSSSWTGD
jgi:hypothetical protein